LSTINFRLACNYDESGVRVWRAFNVGSGKVVPWAKFEGVMKQPEKLELLDSPSQNPSSAPTFKIERHQHIKKSSVKADFSTEIVAQSKSDGLPPLPMGWALKTIKKKVCFKKKQTEF
ncbi:unnamed protein product, partial [Pocillopora meandrina]